MRGETRPPNRSWRVDKTYVKMAGNWTHLYRAVAPGGETIDFILSPNRDLIAAKLFLRLAHPAAIRYRWPPMWTGPTHASAVVELKLRAMSADGALPNPRLTSTTSSRRTIGSRQNHGFRSVEGARQTIEGSGEMHAIRKGQIRRVVRGEPVAHRQFIHPIFGIAAYPTGPQCLRASAFAISSRTSATARQPAATPFWHGSRRASRKSAYSETFPTIRR